MKLVIVESPNKKRTIQKYLGDDYKVEASVGHITILAMDGKYNMGVDEDNGLFTPHFIIDPKKVKVAEKLKALASEAEEIYIATDPDREGEGIAMHLCNLLDIDPNNANRLEFHEITKYAINNALDNVRHIDLKLYDSQEARRILDRIIGFKTSYIVNRDIQSNSAGRVQSVVLGFLYDRDEEIKNFKPTSYYFINSILDENTSLYYSKENDEKYKFVDKEEALNVLNSLSNKQVLKDIRKENKETKSFAPYILSTLQQACSITHHYKIGATLEAAKTLFEDGYITYPRTDSIRLAPEFINKVKAYITDNYGLEYVGVAKVQSGKGNSQDAHEALRPTDLAISPKEIEGIYLEKLKKDKYGKTTAKRLYNVYEMIYKRVIQSIMKPRIDEITTYEFDNNSNRFIYKETKNIFKGFSILDKKEKEVSSTIDFTIGNEYECSNEIEEKETTSPLPYTEGGLVKKMEETGIGRPSTYASTVSTIINSGYATSSKFITITSQGIKTTEYLRKHFIKSINVEYTSKMEEQLDTVATGKVNKIDVIKAGYDDFMVEFNEILHNPDYIGPEPTGDLCPVCGKPLVKRVMKTKTFVSCSGYPECKYIQPEFVGRDCPTCGKPLVYKVGKFGKFVACSGFPDCKYTEFTKKTFKRK